MAVGGVVGGWLLVCVRASATRSGASSAWNDEDEEESKVRQRASGRGGAEGVGAEGRGGEGAWCGGARRVTLTANGCCDRRRRGLGAGKSEGGGSEGAAGKGDGLSSRGTI